MSDAEQTDNEDFSELKTAQNRKNKKAGGWQSLGLDHPIFKAIQRQGYNQPTPIQRKAIPPILDGKDTVAMSRTGSGKTAAFVIPMLQKLKQRDMKGARALLLSPTRELAMQTFKVVKELGRFTGLRCACLVGGDNMEDQFESLHQNPDIILATPGRLLHIAVEMNLKLTFVEYVVFDEADRLFEMGLAEQLHDILKRLPDNRQTLLFSATLPKMLIEFANAGLSEPVLVRLDVETKISDKLTMQFFSTRMNDKLGALLSLAREAERNKEQTIIFCATIRHVEYYVAMFKETGIIASYLHSQMEPSSRRFNIQRFRDKVTMLLVVTDVAARGVDIPLLDCVINVHFPAKPKLFVHRVGRVARAGKSGRAISLVSPDEYAYLMDLLLFLNVPLRIAKEREAYNEQVSTFGRFPEALVHLEDDFIKYTHERALEISDLRNKSENAMKKFISTKPPPSAESVRRAKAELAKIESPIHPYFKEFCGTEEQTNFLNGIKNWRPQATIFELNVGSKNQGAQIMKLKRKKHQKIIDKKKYGQKDEQGGEDEGEDKIENEEADETSIQKTFNEVVSGRKFDPEFTQKPKKRKLDEEKQKEKEQNYLRYTPADQNTERQLAVNDNFERAAQEVSIDINADDDKGIYKMQHKKKWDRKHKKFITDPSASVKRIRTEEGTWVPASYKSGRYEQWTKKQKVGVADDDDQQDEPRRKKFKGKMPQGPKVRSERKSGPQIAKERKRKEKIQNFQNERRHKRLQRSTNKSKFSKVRK
uniref:RNA helicase n=1 Tax=Bursaphelenchus xylophilus TaxID=6326 RepID=A0A1I7RI25_BURXY